MPSGQDFGPIGRKGNEVNEARMAGKHSDNAATLNVPEECSRSPADQNVVSIRRIHDAFERPQAIILLRQGDRRLGGGEQRQKEKEKSER
jgi:hypothetical protein